MHKKGKGVPNLNMICNITGLSRARICEEILEWEEKNREKFESQSRLRAEAKKYVLEAFSSVGSPRKTRELSKDSAFSRRELNIISQLAQDRGVDELTLRKWFKRRSEIHPDKSFEEIRAFFERGPNRNSIRAIADFIGLSAAGLNQWLVKWRSKKENKGKTQIDGINEFIRKRSRENVLKEREQGKPGADKMAIIVGLPDDHARKLGATSEFVSDIAEWMEKYEDSDTNSVRALDFAIRTMAISRAMEIADSIVEALDQSIVNLEKAMDEGKYNFTSNMCLDWNEALTKFFHPGLCQVFKDYGLDGIVPESAREKLVAEVTECIVNNFGRDEVETNDIETIKFTVLSLESVVRNSLLHEGTMRQIFLNLPQGVRDKIQRDIRGN